MVTHHHKGSFSRAKIAVITLSTTRSLAEDKSGKWMCKHAIREGHEIIWHKVIPDDLLTIRNTFLEVREAYHPDAILMTGGTGISPQDVTIEAIRPLFDKELSAFATLFTLLSFEEIDSAAILSRATAGVVGSTILFCMPGSIKACKLACKALIFPELGHLVKHVMDL